MRIFSLFVAFILATATSHAILVDNKPPFNPIDLSNAPLNTPAPVSLTNATQSQADDLFRAVMQKILSESSKFADRFDLLLPFWGFSNSSKRHSVLNHIFPRQAKINSLISQSPLRLVTGQGQATAQSSNNAHAIDEASSLALRVSQSLLTKDELLTNKAFDFNPLNVLAHVKAPGDLCPFRTNIFCNPSDRFSAIDGSCNNLQQPWFGKAETPYKRYMSPAYDDQLSAPRSRSVRGNPLPNPRTISRTMSNENFQTDDRITHIVATFGQFLAHDFTSAAVSSGLNLNLLVSSHCLIIAT